jgi:hypothetical protein
MDKCVGCQFYDRNEIEAEDKGMRWGKCRRTGPIVHPVSAKAYMVEGIWPHVRDDDWCGEWAAKKRRDDAPLADVRNLMMQSAATPVRTSTLPPGALMQPMTPMSSAAATPAPPGPRPFGSD